MRCVSYFHLYPIVVLQAVWATMEVVRKCLKYHTLVLLLKTSCLILIHICNHSSAIIMLRYVFIKTSMIEISLCVLIQNQAYLGYIRHTRLQVLVGLKESSTKGTTLACF